MRRIFTAFTIALMVISTPVKAEEIHTTEATAYCITGQTATGTQTIEGRTVAGMREWFGKTMILYLNDGDNVIKPENYIGTYVVEDTGSAPIRNGQVIDVYIADYNRAKQFGRKNVIFQLVDSEG